MTKHKLLSLVLAVMMLTTCVAGALFIGAKAQVQTPTVIYTVAEYEEEGYEHFSDFVAAMQKAAEETWGKDDVLEILFQGDNVSAGPQGDNANTKGTQGLLFSAPTIWREDGTKLPITIRGVDKETPRDSSIYLDAIGGWYACANDYTFVNMTVPLARQETQFYAGSGNIAFVNCDLNFSGTSQVLVPTRDEFEEMAALSTYLSEHVRDTYDVDLIPVNDAAMLAAESEAFGDETLGHLIFATSNVNGVDYGDWRHEGDVGGGQYLYACVLFETLTKKSCIGNTFRPSYDLRYDDMTFEELQQIAHKAVAAEYGEDYCTEVLPDDIGGDDIYNFLIIGSSNAYYCIDELASVARAAGVNMRVHHAYTSSIAFSTIAGNILNNDGSYSMQVWYDADGKGAVKSSEMSSKKLLSDILPAKEWDSVAVFETTNHLDDFGFDPAKHEANKTNVINNCIYTNKTTGATYGIGDVYNFFKKDNSEARMLWYEVGTSPIGAYGSDSTNKGYLFADNCTDAAFIGWPELKEGETVKTGVTIGDGVNFYDSSVIRVAASGYRFNQNSTALTDAEAKEMKYYASEAEGAADIRPYQVEPTLTIDGEGALLHNVSTKLGGAPSNATVHLKKGTVNMIYGDNNTSQSGDTEGKGEKYYGDMNVVVTGGSLRGVNMLVDAHLQGDMNLTVNPLDGEITIQKFLRGLFGSGANPGSCTGDVTFDIQGVTLSDAIHGGGGSGKVKNIIKNVTFDSAVITPYIGVRCGSPSSVENILENVTYSGTSFMYLGAYESQVNGDIKNTLKNCTVSGNLYCGNYTGSILGNIENNFIGGTYGSITYNDAGKPTANYNTYGGSQKAGATIRGAIKNKITGATFAGGWFYGGNGFYTNEKGIADTGATFAENTSLTNRIINEIDGASFVRFAGGSEKSAVDKVIKNTIFGDETKFSTGFYCGTNSAAVNKTVNYFRAKMSGWPSGGSNGGTVKEVVNFIEEGADLVGIYAASNGGSTGLTKNVISGGKVVTFYGGSRANTLNGSIENTIMEGADITTFYGGAKDAAVTGSVKNFLKGGQGQIGTFYGGSENANVSSIHNILQDGTWPESIHEGNKAGEVTTITRGLGLGQGTPVVYGEITFDTISGEGVLQVGKDASVTISGEAKGKVTVEQIEAWQDRTYFTATGSDITIFVLDKVSGTATVEDNSVIGSVLDVTYTAPVAVSLVLDTRVGVRFYFVKETVTEDFNYKVTMGGKTLAEGNYASLTEEDAYMVLSFGGIGLSDFMTEFVLEGDTIRDSYSKNYDTIVEIADLGAQKLAVTTDKELFQSIADLGRVERGMDAKYSLFYQKVTPNSTGKSGEEGSLLSFKRKNLLMSDAIGIRLYGTAKNADDCKDLQVIVDGKDVTKLCDISDAVLEDGVYKFTVDIFIKAVTMHDKMNIEILDQNKKMCLTLSDQVDWIAQQILNNEPDNDLAKQVLIYIQKVYNFVNNVQTVIPPSAPGTEIEIGDKVKF